MHHPFGADADTASNFSQLWSVTMPQVVIANELVSGLLAVGQHKGSLKVLMVRTIGKK